MQYLSLYLLLINALSWHLMRKDKQKAKSHSWRIPEATLLLTALLGGSLGALLAMCIFHHKTKHPQFSIGIPLMLLAQITILILFLT